MKQDLGHESPATGERPESVTDPLWKIGQKVKCIKSFPLNIHMPHHPAEKYQLHERLKVGQVYTIRALNLKGPHNPDLIGSGCGLYLDEIKNPKWPSDDSPEGWLEISYDQNGFEVVS
jgi:hypothetical protein